MNHLGIDEIFSVLENPTRRRILGLLSMETHYPLQLARELGISQQAVGKHIKVLEEHGLIRSFEEPSDIGGPPRKYYIPIHCFSMRIDMGPGVFETSYLEREGRKMSSSILIDKKEAPSRSTGQRTEVLKRTEMLKKISRELKILNSALETIENERMKLLNRREELLESAGTIVGTLIPNYIERRLIYHLIEEGPTPMEEISERFDRRIKQLRKLQEGIEEQYGLNWLFGD